MLKPIVGVLWRVVAAIAIVVAALLFAPVMLPEQGRAQALVLAVGLEVWHTVRSVALWLGGSIVLAWLFYAMRGDRAMYADENGQLPIPWRVLRKHPEIALRTIQQHQETRIIAAKNPMPTHFNYSPKFAPAAEQPLLEAPEIVLPERVSLSEVRQRIPRGEFALGVLDSNKLLSAPPGMCYHMLFNGETRSGKSNAINGIITQLHEQAAHGMPVRLYAGDRKGEFARVWSTSPLFPDGVAISAADIADMLAEVVNDPTTGLESRNRVFSKAAHAGGRTKHVIASIEDYERVTGEHLERVFIIVDEINALMLEASKDNRLEASLMQLLQMGAGYGFYLLAGAQHLTAATLGTEGKYNFTTRAHFGDYNQNAINMLFGKVDADTLKPHMDGTKGRGLIKTVGNAAPVLFQSVHCEERDILKALELVRPPLAAAGAMPMLEHSAISAKSTSSDTPATPEPAPPKSAKSAKSTEGEHKHALFYALGGKPEDIDRILLLARADNGKLSRRAIARTVYDKDGGDPYKRVAAVLDAEGIQAKR